MRASVVAERAGIPSASLVGEGFMRQAATTAVGLGMPNIPVALVPGHPGVQTDEELRRNILDVTVERVLESLIRQPDAAQEIPEPSPEEIVYRGSFAEVNDFFYENEWSDGLPIVPPTRDRIGTFLRFTDRSPDEALGVLLPDNRGATIWSIAVNGVMAGCRPEYMPILIAMVEVLCDPEYGHEHSSNTPGSETLIILNGPIIKQLDFNYEQGVLRDGFRPNTSVGRFWRLYLRNVAGFLLHKTDKATFGGTWRVVLAENEGVLERIGWAPNSVEMGFDAGDNTVTAARYSGGDVIASVTTDRPETMLPYVADAMLRMYSWQVVFNMGVAIGTIRPLLVLTPILAETIANAGWSKQDVKQYLFDHARMPAWKYDKFLQGWTDHTTTDVKGFVRLGKAPKLFWESDDPDRLLPITFEPDDFMIAVAGDLMRTNAYAFAHNGSFGYPVGKKIRLPREWEQLLAERRT